MRMTRLRTTSSSVPCLPLRAHWCASPSWSWRPPPQEQQLCEPFEHRRGSRNGPGVPPPRRGARGLGEQHGDPRCHLRRQRSPVKEVIEEVLHPLLPTVVPHHGREGLVGYAVRAGGFPPLPRCCGEQ